MSKIETFFRSCPSCGKRFEVRLVSKTLIGSQRIEENLPMDNYPSELPDYFLPLGETKPAVIDEEDFQYAYKCMHCGHEWMEKREKFSREKD